MTSNKVKRIEAGVFIDGSNMFYGMNDSKVNWNIDYLKLKDHLRKRYKPKFYKYYGCIDEIPKTEKYVKRAKGTKKFYNKLEGNGYDVITKPLKYIGDSTKCDMDVDIVCDVKDLMIDINNIILFSGDSDFLRLVEDCHQEGKHIRIYSFKHMLAWEMKKFAIDNTRCNYIFLDDLKKELEYTKK